MEIVEFGELRRRWQGAHVIPRRGKYYGTIVENCDGCEVAKFWTADGHPSEREKAYFADWTPEKWADYCCDSHWECDADYRAALEFCALAARLQGQSA